MLSKTTYEVWTKPFNATSKFVGDWSEGSKMIFLGTDPKTSEQVGMVSRIAERRDFKRLSIEHIGEVKGGKEQVSDNEVPSYESYVLTEKDGQTELQIELTNISDDQVDWMDDLWPKSLDVLKTLSER